MITLQILISVLSGFTAAALVIDIMRDRTAGVVAIAGLVLVEVAILVQLGWGIVRLFGPHPGVAIGAYVGYLLGSVVILPVAYFWADTEKSRSGTAVLLAAVVVVPVLCLRLHTIWTGHV